MCSTAPVLPSGGPATPLRTSSVPPALPVVSVRPGSSGTGHDSPAFRTRLNRIAPCGSRTSIQLLALALMTREPEASAADATAGAADVFVVGGGTFVALSLAGDIAAAVVALPSAAPGPALAVVPFVPEDTGGVIAASVCVLPFVAEATVPFEAGAAPAAGVVAAAFVALPVPVVVVAAGTEVSVVPDMPEPVGAVSAVMVEEPAVDTAAGAAGVGAG